MEGAFKACSRENFLHHCPGMVMVGEFLEMEMGECVLAVTKCLICLLVIRAHTIEMALQGADGRFL